MKYFSTEMTENEAREKYFRTLPKCDEEEAVLLKTEFEEAISGIVRKKLKLAREGWMVN